MGNANFQRHAALTLSFDRSRFSAPATYAAPGYAMEPRYYPPAVRESVLERPDNYGYAGVQAIAPTPRPRRVLILILD